MPYVIIAYDTPSALRRRALLAKTRGALFHIQKSVFEGDLRRGDLRRLGKALADIVDPTRDSVRVFTLCPSCADRAKSLAGRHETRLPRLLVLGDK